MWWRIPLSNPSHADTGLIDDPTGATMYAFPSIAVNKYGAALIGYSVFNASIYPSAGYSYIDPLNNLSTPALLKTGDAPSHFSRWADFSTTVVDANDIDFWTNQTYAPVGPCWATWWSKIDMPPCRADVRSATSVRRFFAAVPMRLRLPGGCGRRRWPICGTVRR